jgi:nucleotide-binding universal stress UspA family protein
MPTESDKEASSNVDDAVKALVGEGIDAHGAVEDTVFGHAARYITEAAKEHGADVIVMGSRGRTDVAGMVLGSTAHKVIHLTDLPVLVVR